MDRFFAAVLAGTMEGATYGLIALGIVLVYKATRVLNFAQAEIGTIAVYIVYAISNDPPPGAGLGLPVVVGVVVALAAAAVMGAGVEYVLRPLAAAPRLTVTVATLGVSAALGSAEILLFTTDAHTAPSLVSGTLFTLGGINVDFSRVLALIVTSGLGIGLYYFFKRTLFGLGVLAAAQDQTALRLMGLPENRVSVFTWATGAVLSALAGIILAPTLGSFTPFFMTLTLIPGLAAALVGGLTSLPGAFLGGIIIGIAQNVTKTLFGDAVPGVEFVAVYAAMVLTLLFRPQGLLGAEA